MKQLKESEPVIVLSRTSHGVALRKIRSITPFSRFDSIIRTGSSATLHPDGQVDIHGTPSEEGTFQLAGHWLESDRSDIQLLIPQKRPQSLEWGFWKNMRAFFESEEVLLRRKKPYQELPNAERIIVFGQVLITCDSGFTTRVYPLGEVSYDAKRKFRALQIPVSSPSPVPVSP